MPSLERLIETIRHSPRLHEVIELLQAQIESEKAKRAEFYDEMTPSQKMEFINGEVVLHSPAKNWHLDATGLLFRLIGSYVDVKGLGTVKSEKCLCVFPRNDYEPDIVFFGETKTGTLSPDTLKFPVPDLAVEVLSSSTEKNDRGVKFEDYQTQGVIEYWIIDTENQSVEQYRLDKHSKEYERIFSSNTGLMKSEVIADLEFPVEAIFDERTNIEVLKSILS